MISTVNVDELVHVDSKHPFHEGLYRTLVLLAIDTETEPVYFVVDGVSGFVPAEEVRQNDLYFYEEGTCPINVTRVVMVSHMGDHDPHGVFRYVDTVWRPKDFDPSDEYRIAALFPDFLRQESEE